jgi:hypothetical protein
MCGNRRSVRKCLWMVRNCDRVLVWAKILQSFTSSFPILEATTTWSVQDFNKPPMFEIYGKIGFPVGGTSLNRVSLFHEGLLSLSTKFKSIHEVPQLKKVHESLNISLKLCTCFELVTCPYARTLSHLTARRPH